MNRRRGRASPRAVLLGALVFIAVGWAIYLVSPWLLPVRIISGPLVQEAGPDGVTLIWYTSRALRPGECEVLVEGRPERKFAVESDGERGRAQITGLEAGNSYPYRVQLGRRTLAEASFLTNVRSDRPFTFIAFGDSGLGTHAQYLLAAAMRGPEFAPNFILHTGDLVYKHGEWGHYDYRFFAPYRELLARINFWPSLGNHDVMTDGGAPFLGAFDLPRNGPAGLTPESNYWFDYAAARIAVIDSTLPEETLAKAVAPWLKEVFGASSATWKFAVMHHPPYTCGGHAADVRIQRAIVPALEEAGVDLVFSGHDHLYERMFPLRGGQVTSDKSGITYIVTGAGGAKLYAAPPPGQRPAYVAVLDNTQPSFTYVQVDGRELRLRQIGLSGRVIDDWKLTK